MTTPASLLPSGLVQRWANDDLRSLNAQNEFLLRRALPEAGLRDVRRGAPPPGREPR